MGVWSHIKEPSHTVKRYLLCKVFHTSILLLNNLAGLDTKSCAITTILNIQVIYCYGDLVPRHGELFAEGGEPGSTTTSSKDLLAAQLGLWAFGIFAL